MPQTHFVVYGVGPLRDEMKAFACKAGIADRVHLPGTLEDPALGLGVMDLFLLTSQLEGTPNVVLEASLLGLPVVVTDAGGTCETVDQGQTGFVVSEATPDALAEASARVLQDRGFCEDIRNRGPAFVRTRFGLERMIDETLKAYGMAANAAPGDQEA